MIALSIFSILFTLVYIALIVYLIYQWNKIRPNDQITIAQAPYVSIVISARNEEDHILECIHSCLNQDYPKHLLEIIVVDDQSEESTYELVESIEDSRLVLMRLGVTRRTTIKGSKKKALAYGINHAKGEIICTTDADCIVPEHWVNNMVSYFSDPRIKMVSGPVKILEEDGFINRFQSLDFSTNGLINAAGIHTKQFYLANAANLAYRKQVFLEEDAFENNYHIASGDDVFLMEKIRTKYPDGIAFVKLQSATVETRGLTNWSTFISQRLRWAGKMSIIKDWTLKGFPAFVWMQRVLLLTLFIIGLIQSDIKFILISFSCFILQWLVDFILQIDACRFFKIRNWEIWFVPIAFLHNIYFIALGILSWLPIPTDWKGRRV